MLTGLSLPALLEELAAPREVPGAGSALAAALAAAAAVVQMAARLSPASWADAAGVAAQAEALRERAVQLVDEDAEAYRLVWSKKATEVQVLERLDERRRTEHELEATRQADLEVDDIVVTRFGRNEGGLV